MRYLSAARLLAVTATIFVVAVACGGDDEELQPTSPGVAIEPPSYALPSAVTPGDYEPVRSGKSARAILEPLGFEPATGDEINGIRLFDYYTEYFHYKDLCGESDFKEFREYDALDFDWLPPGTSAVGPEAAAMCPDDSVAGIGQEFMTCCSMFQVWYSVGKRALLHQGAGGGKFAGEINGSAAVVVAQSEEGWSHSQVGLTTSKGIMMLEAWDMPLEDVMNIAMRIRCDMC